MDGESTCLEINLNTSLLQSKSNHDLTSEANYKTTNSEHIWLNLEIDFLQCHIKTLIGF